MVTPPSPSAAQPGSTNSPPASGRDTEDDRLPGTAPSAVDRRVHPLGGGETGDRRRGVIRIGLVALGVTAHVATSPAPLPTSTWVLVGALLLYAVVLVLAAPWTAERPRFGGAIRTADALIALLWIGRTGGLASPWLVASYVFLASIALRYSARTTAIITLPVAAGIVIMAVVCHELPERLGDLAIRVAFLLVIPLTAGFTARERARLLTARTRLLSLAQEVAQVGTWEWAIDSGRLYWSSELYRIFGVAEGTPTTTTLFRDAIHPDDVENVFQIIGRATQGEPMRMDHRIVRGDGAIRWLHCCGRLIRDERGQPLELVGSSQDVTDVRTMQEQLKFSEKLASIGTMASGIAHEINNPLSYLSNNVAIIERRLAEAKTRDHELRDAVAAVKHAAVRVRDIVHGLKTFSRNDGGEFAAVDVGKTADMAVAIAAHEIGQHARLIRSYRGAPHVVGSESRLSQVFVNLLVNAAQAFPPGNEADHEIHLEIAEADGRVTVVITDNGSGIPPELTARIFDPFFTTKPPGVGTGLGLSICHGIVKEHGGTITVESEVGRGTSFRIELPAADAPPPSAPPSIRDTREGEPLRTRILIIDDEPRYVRSLVMLLQENHQVASAPNGTEALTLIAQSEPFDLILCDLMMPEMTGMALYERLSEEQRRQVVFLTGGATTDAARAFLARPGIRYLEKPVEVQEIERLAVRRGKARTGGSGN